MEKPLLNTNRKIMSILGVGEDMRRLVDPEGLLSSGQVSEFTHSKPHEGRCTWRMVFVFPHGDSVSVGGTMEADSLLIVSVSMPEVGGKNLRLKVAGSSRTFLSAIGDLSVLPPRFKRCLSPIGKPAGETDRLFGQLRSFFILEDDAVFWDVEGGEKSSPYRKLFKEYCSRFVYSDSGNLQKVDICAFSRLVEGKLLVRADLDVYGLGNKRVTLVRNLGMGRQFSGDCVIVKDGIVKPSIVAAIDLDSCIPVMYSKERHKDKTMGRPKASIMKK